jgi:hypothetical protein
MRERIVLALILAGLFVGATGCRKQVDRTVFLSAINESFKGHHDCVWPEPIKLPVKANPNSDDRVRAFDALVDAGLFSLVSKDGERSPAGLKQINTYNLSDKGRSFWTPEADKPGYGNFCFGHFNATNIDKATPNDSANPTQYTVNYRYEVLGIPEWVHTPESMRTFRNLAADTSIQSATATLSKGTSGGWTVDSPQSPR